MLLLFAGINTQACMDSAMLKIAHIINPVAVPDTSDLYTAQPVTFETLRRAKEFAKNEVEVHLFTAQYPEDKSFIPDFFTQTPDLDRSVLDVPRFHGSKKLPLIKDILNRLYEASDADLLVYSNADIALQPFFYSTVIKLIGQGADSILVNRRTIPAIYKSVAQLEKMYSEEGLPHEGIDCFIFRRDMYKRFYFADACIGSGPVGLCFALNIALNSTGYVWLEDRKLTFHIGDDKAWKNKGRRNELLIFNFRQYSGIIDYYLMHPEAYPDDKAGELVLIKKFAKAKIRQLFFSSKFLARLVQQKGIHPKDLLRNSSLNPIPN